MFLKEVAGWRLPQVAILLDFQTQRFGTFEGLGESGEYSSNVESSFYTLTGALRDRSRQAAEAVRESAEALQDVVALYRRADGQG